MQDAERFLIDVLPILRDAVEELKPVALRNWSFSVFTSQSSDDYSNLAAYEGQRPDAERSQS
jgi:hypothetical protein